MSVISIVGNIVADAYISKDKKFATIKVAVNEDYKDSKSGEWVKKTSFYSVFIHGEKRIEYAEKAFNKGLQVYVVGIPSLSSEKLEDGTYKESFTIKNPTIKVLRGGGSGGGRSISPAVLEKGAELQEQIADLKATLKQISKGRLSGDAAVEDLTEDLEPLIKGFSEFFKELVTGSKATSKKSSKKAAPKKEAELEEEEDEDLEDEGNLDF